LRVVGLAGDGLLPVLDESSLIPLGESLEAVGGEGVPGRGWELEVTLCLDFLRATGAESGVGGAEEDGRGAVEAGEMRVESESLRRGREEGRMDFVGDSLLKFVAVLAVEDGNGRGLGADSDLMGRGEEEEEEEEGTGRKAA